MPNSIKNFKTIDGEKVYASVFIQLDLIKTKCVTLKNDKRFFVKNDKLKVK